MQQMTYSLYNIRLLDELSKQKTFIHNLHPLIKLITTVFYITVVMSYGKYEIIRLFPLIVYPVFIFTLGDIPIAPVMKRLLLIEPFIIGIGILNPIFDNTEVSFVGVTVSAGWINFISILLKSALTVTACILLVTTTGIEKLAAGLRMLKIPKIFVLQLLLTYRYVSILIEEALRMQRAYKMRAPTAKGVNISSWGSFAGQLLLRSLDRAERIYRSMSMRGFSGEYNTGVNPKAYIKDFAYLAGWSLFFTLVRLYNLPMLIGGIFA